MSAVRLVVYSDFLCPWCWNAATRLASVREQLGGDLAIEWRSYLLRPSGQPGRSLEKFRAYTQSWLRVAEDEPRALWSEAQLPDDAFAGCDDPEHRRRVLADHEEAQALGATGVPAVRLADQDFVLVGAQPEAVYLRWLRRAIDTRVA